MKYRAIEKILISNGFVMEPSRRGRGCHRMFKREVDGQIQKVTVPFHSKEIKPGTLGSIIRGSGLKKNLFKK